MPFYLLRSGESSSGYEVSFAPRARGFHAVIDSVLEPDFAEIKKIVQLNFGSQLANGDVPSEFTVLAALDRGIVGLDARQRPLVTAVRRRFKNSEEVADEAVEPFTTRTRPPYHPKLVRAAPTSLLKPNLT